MLFELYRGERTAERSSAREKLTPDRHRQIVPIHNYCRPETMRNVLFFVDQGSALCPVCIEATALILPSGQGAGQRVVFTRSV